MGNSSVANESNSTVEEKIKIGKTTKDDVIALYGRPSSTSTGASSSEVWTYMFTSGKADAKNFIPLVGIFIAKNDYASNILTVTFRKDGVVSDYRFSSSNSSSQMGKTVSDEKPAAAANAAGKPILLDDKGRASIIADLGEKELIGDEQTQNADFGTGINRRSADAIHKKGKPWHLIVFAQRPASKWQVVAEQEVAISHVKGLRFGGTLDGRNGASDEDPTYQCFVNGKKAVVFGFMIYNTTTYGYTHAATGKEVVWTLDANDKLVSLAKDKVECRAKF